MAVNTRPTWLVAPSITAGVEFAIGAAAPGWPVNTCWLTAAVGSFSTGIASCKPHDSPAGGWPVLAWCRAT